MYDSPTVTEILVVFHTPLAYYFRFEPPYLFWYVSLVRVNEPVAPAIGLAAYIYIQLFMKSFFHQKYMVAHIDIQ